MDCRLSREDGTPIIYENVHVKNKDPLNEHTYQTVVVVGTDTDHYASDTIYVDNVKPLETGKNSTVDSNPSTSVTNVPDGPVPCKITEITDYDTGAVVEA